MTKSSAARKSDKEQAPSFYSIGAEILDASGGDTQLALKRMLAKLNRDPKLLRTLLTQDVVNKLCRDAILTCAGARRRAIWQPPPQHDERGRLLHLAQATSDSLLDMRFTGFPSLGDCTRAQVLEIAERYENHASDSMHKMRWMRLIGQHLTDGQRVRDAMTHERLRELQKETEHG